MLPIRKIKADKYLKNFIKYCKEKFGDNLAAIVIYGSYAWGYFDKKKSDYDVFMIFKDKIPYGEKELRKKFKKVGGFYYLNIDELLKRAHLGHWTSYITLLTSARVLYSTKEYEKFLRKLKKINLLEEIIDIAGVELRSINRANILKKTRGYKAVKWALASIRVQLQLFSYLRYKKLIWNIKENLKKNKDILTKEEMVFLEILDKKVRKRINKFNKKDKNMALNLIYKLNKEIIFSLKKL